MHTCAYIHTVEFEWDPRKARANLNKHGVDFADAAMVLYDEFALTVAEDDPQEERFVTMGRDALDRILVLAYTWRGQRVRVISARKATPTERRKYEGER